MPTPENPAIYADLLDRGVSVAGRQLTQDVELVDVTWAEPPVGNTPGRRLSLLAALNRLESRVAEIERTTQATAGDALSAIAASVARIAGAVAPEPEEIVGTPYVAKKLGCTTVWVAEMVRKGEIPPSCVVAGTGNGKPWRFHRARIDAWIASR